MQYRWIEWGMAVKTTENLMVFDRVSGSLHVLLNYEKYGIDIPAGAGHDEDGTNAAEISVQVLKQPQSPAGPRLVYPRELLDIINHAVHDTVFLGSAWPGVVAAPQK